MSGHLKQFIILNKNISFLLNIETMHSIRQKQTKLFLSQIRNKIKCQNRITILFLKKLFSIFISQINDPTIRNNPPPLIICF